MIGRRLVAAGLGAVLAAPVTAAPETNARRVLGELALLHRVIERYHRDVGEPPPDARALGTLARVGAAEVRQAGGFPVDGWGHRFRYERDTSERGYALYSVGRDGVDDGGAGDDLVSRETADRRLYPELLVAQRRALQLFPLLLLLALSPILWAVLRRLRR